MARYAILSLLLLLPLAIGPGCSTDNSSNMMAGAGAPPSSSAGAGGEAGQASNQALSDPQIVQILLSANAGEVRLGKFALMRASSTAVHDFAQVMVSDHSVAEQQVESLAAANGLTPRASGTSELLDANAAAIQGELAMTSGADFDSMYMSDQVDMHQGLLTLIDEQLLPAVMNPELHSLIEATRTTIATNLDQARELVVAM